MRWQQTWATVLPILTLVMALLWSLAAIPTIIRLSHKFKWYDFHDQRKIHTGLISRLGGVGIALSFLVSVLVSALLVRPLVRLQLLGNWHHLFLVAGFLTMHLTGLVDDFHNLRAFRKFLLQICAAALVTAGGFLIDTITIPYVGTISIGLLAYPVTIVWIVGISNAFNFIDGMDGLAAGIGSIAALSMGIVALLAGQTLTAIIAFSLAGAIFGFLFFNFPPARIFMGDSGSLSIGFALAVIPLLGISRVASFATLIIPITLLTVPIVDTFTAIVRRLRQQRPVYAADREHIHHKLLHMGLSERRILLVLYSFSVYLGVISVTSVTLPQQTNVYLILVVWVGSMLGYGLLTYVGSKRTSQRSKSEQHNSLSARQ